MHRKQWIFDMDGTLTDSMTVVWQGAPLELLRRYGRTARPGIHDVLLSMGDGGGRGISHPHLRSAPDLRDYEPAMRQVIRDLYKKVELKPGVREMLARLKAEGVRMCICSNTWAEQCEEVLTGWASQTISSSSTPHRARRARPTRGVPRSPRAAGRQRTRRRRRLRGRCLRHPYGQAVRLLPHRHRG